MTQVSSDVANITTITIMVITTLLSLACCYSLFLKGVLLTLICSSIALDCSLNPWTFCLYSVVTVGFEAFQVL